MGDNSSLFSNVFIYVNFNILNMTNEQLQVSIVILLVCFIVFFIVAIIKTKIQLNRLDERSYKKKLLNYLEENDDERNAPPDEWRIKIVNLIREFNEEHETKFNPDNIVTEYIEKVIYKNV